MSLILGNCSKDSLPSSPQPFFSWVNFVHISTTFLSKLLTKLFIQIIQIYPLKLLLELPHRKFSLSQRKRPSANKHVTIPMYLYPVPSLQKASRQSSPSFPRVLFEKTESQEKTLSPGPCQAPCSAKDPSLKVCATVRSLAVP